MNVLLLGTDASAFTEGSALHHRLLAYGTRVETLSILVISSSVHPHKKIAENVFLYSVGGTPLIRFLRAVKKGKSIAKEKSIHVVSAQDPFEIGWVGMKVAESVGATLHVQVHTDIGSPFFKIHSWKNRIRLHVARRVLPRARGVRAVSKRSAEGVRTLSPKSTITILPIRAVPPQEVLPQKKKPFGFTLLMLGRLTKEKDIETAIKTLVLLKKAYPTLGLLIVGEGSERTHLEAFARGQGVAERVMFAGPLPTYEALGQAHALLHTSRYEGYGLVFIESALAGVPNVATDVGIMGDIFKNEESALVCPVGDTACLKTKISELIEDVRLQFTLRENAKLAAETHVISEEEYLDIWKKDIVGNFT